MLPVPIDFWWPPSVRLHIELRRWTLTGGCSVQEFVQVDIFGKQDPR